MNPLVTPCLRSSEKVGPGFTARGSRGQQAGKLETRPLFAGSQGGTVAPAGGTTCAARSVRLHL